MDGLEIAEAGLLGAAVGSIVGSSAGRSYRAPSRSYYGGYGYGGTTTVRVPDPLPAAGWTCGECGEARSETGTHAVSRIDRFKELHQREHRYEKLGSEEAREARKADLDADLESDRIKSEMMSRHLDLMMSAWGDHSEKQDEKAAEEVEDAPVLPVASKKKWWKPWA